MHSECNKTRVRTHDLWILNRMFLAFDALVHFWFKSGLDGRTMQLKFDVIGVQTHDLQIMDSTFLEMPS